MDGGDVVIKSLNIIFLSLSVNARYVFSLYRTDICRRRSWMQSFQKKRRGRWRRKWCETDRSAMSSPNWPSTANSNAMKHWAKVKNITSALLPATLCLSSHQLNKYPINNQRHFTRHSTNTRLHKNSCESPHVQLKHFILVVTRARQ